MIFSLIATPAAIRRHLPPRKHGRLSPLGRALCSLFAHLSASLHPPLAALRRFAPVFGEGYVRRRLYKKLSVQELNQWLAKKKRCIFAKLPLVWPSPRTERVARSAGCGETILSLAAAVTVVTAVFQHLRFSFFHFFSFFTVTL